MSATQELIDKIKREVAQKKKSREALLDQLGIVDAELDLIDGLIEPYDAAALGFIDNINPTVNPIKQAYDARIAAGCRSDLIWEDQGSSSYTAFISGNFTIINQRTWKAVKNTATADFTPFYGLKYYQKPIDRDYGTTIVANFIGSVEDGKPVIAVTQQGGIPPAIQINDTITDSLDSPTIFSLGNLPEVVSIGTTQAVGFVTTLTGGITTGSNQFYHFGAGEISMVQTGMVLTLSGILTTNTIITGFSTGTWPIEYIDDNGVLTTASIDATILTLDKPALDYTEESVFNVGIITTYPALFLSTNTSTTQEGIEFTALRISQDIDAGFDYTSNPNAPLTIGTINSSNLGIGGSVYIDSSGDPNQTQSWNPGQSYTDPTNGEIVNPEPKVGAGRVDYNIGTLQWPTVTVSQSNGEGPIITSTRYATEGTVVRVSSESSSSIGYANQPSGGFPPDCGSYDAAIAAAESANQSSISANLPKAESNVNITKALRKERERRQMYAWSLLQGAAKLREEIAEGEELIRQLDNMNN